MLTIFTALLLFLLGLFAWSAQRDHDALLDASVKTLNSLDNLLSLFSPFGESNNIQNRCLRLLETYEYHIAPLQSDLNTNIWKLKLLGYKDISDILNEHESIISEFFKDIILAKSTSNPKGLDKYYDRDTAMTKIKGIQTKIEVQVKPMLDRPFRSKFHRILKQTK